MRAWPIILPRTRMSSGHYITAVRQRTMNRLLYPVHTSEAWCFAGVHRVVDMYHSPLRLRRLTCHEWTIHSCMTTVQVSVQNPEWSMPYRAEHLSMQGSV